MKYKTLFSVPLIITFLLSLFGGSIQAQAMSVVKDANTASSQNTSTVLCDNPRLQGASVRVDAVLLNLCTPFLPGAFTEPEPDNTMQTASAVLWEPYQEFSIIAVPFGASLPSENLPVAQAGMEKQYRAQLKQYRISQGASSQAGPAAVLFGKSIVGTLSVVDIRINTSSKKPVLIVEWVVEAGKRLWIVRAAREYTGDKSVTEQTAAANTLLSQLNVDSANLDQPSSLLQSLESETQRTGDDPSASSPVENVASANLPTPSWWSGECDTNHYSSNAANPKRIKAYPLGGTYRNVKACGPRPSYGEGPNVIVRFFPGAWGEYEWQCVELSMRYMYLAYGIKPYGANGKDVVWNYSGSRLVKVGNGKTKSAPQPGDILSYGPATKYGHTSVVSATNVDANGNGSITIIEQNAVASGTRTHAVKNWVVNNGTPVSGWLHDPLKPTYSALYTSQSAYPSIAQGQSADVWVIFKNTGNTAWSNTGANPVRLGTTNPVTNAIPYASPFACPGWVSSSRPTTLREASVAPGATGSFKFTICVPAGTAPGVYRVAVAPVVEGITWMFQPGIIYWDVTVTPASLAAPTTIAPTSGAVVASPVNFSWNTVSGATGYWVEWSGPATGNSGWINASSYSTGSLPAGAYTWRVKANNSSAESPWSSSIGFTVEPPVQVPGAPGLVSPANGAILPYNAVINLAWNAVNGATEYWVEWSGPATGNSGWVSSSSYAAGALPSGAYTWRVKARNSAGEGAWSETRSFTKQTLITKTVRAPVSQDAYAQAGYPTAAAGLTRNVYLGYESYYGKHQTRVFEQFNLPSLEAGSQINYVRMNLYQYVANCSGSYSVTAYDVAAGWAEAGLTWNNQPGIGASAGSTSFACTVNWQWIDITNLVKQWYSGYRNYGVSLRANNENAAGGIFQAKDCTSPTCSRTGDPYLEINYTYPSP